jgi:hypothetical protein
MSDAVAFIAAQHGGPQRLLAIHVDDGFGRCRGCTVPGTGMPQDIWPCSIHYLASAAAVATNGATE